MCLNIFHCIPKNLFGISSWFGSTGLFLQSFSDLQYHHNFQHSLHLWGGNISKGTTSVCLNLDILAIPTTLSAKVENPLCCSMELPICLITWSMRISHYCKTLFRFWSYIHFSHYEVLCEKGNTLNNGSW